MQEHKETQSFTIQAVLHTSSFTGIKDLARLFLSSQTAKGQHKEKNRIILMQCQLTVVVKKCLTRCQQGGVQCFLQDKSNFKICVESSNTGSSFSLIFILCLLYSIYFGNILRKVLDE